MVDGNSLCSFAARKANDLWPVANLHLGKFKSELRLVFLLCTEKRLTNFCLLFAYANCRLCRAVQILITTSCSTYVKLFERGLNESFIASVFCDQELDGQG